MIAVNLTPKVVAEIRLLVEAGQFASPEQFLEIAAFNQLALEKGSAAGVSEAPPGVSAAAAPDRARRHDAAGPRREVALQYRPRRRAASVAVAAGREGRGEAAPRRAEERAHRGRARLQGQPQVRRQQVTRLQNTARTAPPSPTPVAGAGSGGRRTRASLGRSDAVKPTNWDCHGMSPSTSPRADAADATPAAADRRHETRPGPRRPNALNGAGTWIRGPCGRARRLMRSCPHDESGRNRRSCWPPTRGCGTAARNGVDFGTPVAKLTVETRRNSLWHMRTPGASGSWNV